MRTRRREGRREGSGGVEMGLGKGMMLRGRWIARTVWREGLGGSEERRIYPWLTIFLDE